MSKAVGTFFVLMILGVTVFLLLWLFGVITPSLWQVGKFLLAGGIILGAAGALTVVFGMFFWKGGKEPVPGDQKTAGSEFIGNRYSDNK
jgi:hypothetical protein